ncbi:diguanylate cyclase, partial [Streptomyces sp. DSM 44917]
AQTAPAAPIACSLAGLVPYLAAAVCVLSILVTVVAGRKVDRVVVLAACAVVLALLVRQGITLRDNASLTRELARKENYFRSLVQGSSDVIMIAAPSGTLRYVSPAATGVYGRDPALLTGTELSALIHPDDLGRVRSELRRFLSAPAAAEQATRIECRVRHGAGHWLNVESTVKRHEDGLILNSRDVTERVRLQAQLQHSASHDALTDLPNRALFTERVRMAIGGARGGAPDAAVLYIDLDGFKAVNDSAGHQAGDELLVQAAQRLRDSVRTGDTTARLGGDEFAALIVGEPGGESLRRDVRFLEIAERVRAAISRPYLVDGRRLRVAASVGVAFAEAGTAPAALIRRADLAMYRAKQAGKGRVELYAPHHQPPREGPARRAPRPAAEDRGPGEYALLHQPVVDLADGRVAAVCARPRRPGRPGAGTPAGEAPGWLLEQAVADAARRHREGLTAPVSVRVRADRLADPALGGVGLEALLGRHGLPPGGLIVELPEAGAALASAELRARLSDLGRLGVGLALGGFGSGGTSAAALHRLPVSLLRLDGELVEGLLESPALGTIAAGLLRMAADLGIDSLAGGVDLPAQAAALRALGCRRAQGLAFCEPLEAGRLRRVLGEGSLPVPADARGVPPQADAGRPRALPAPHAARAAPGRAPDAPAPRG